MIKDWKKVKLEKDDESGDIIWRSKDEKLSVSYAGDIERYEVQLYNPEKDKVLWTKWFFTKKEALASAMRYIKKGY